MDVEGHRKRFLWSPRMTLWIFRFSQIESDTDTKRDISNVTIGPLVFFSLYTRYILTML